MGDSGLAVELAHPRLEMGEQQIDGPKLCKVESDRFRGMMVREVYRARSSFCHRGKSIPCRGCSGCRLLG